jgi:agmatinase
LTRAPATDAKKKGPAKNGKTLPRVITLGGDHTITLPLLRSVNRAYGPISVIHFDSHLDTWKPKVFGGSPSKVASINHGTYFYHASQEGLLANDSNIHAGIRTTLSGPSDYENDGYCGFEIVEAREIDTIGMNGIIKKIKDRVGTTKPVYLSIDIDTLDPACKMLDSLHTRAFTKNFSRTCDRDSRDRWLVHTRTPYYSERIRRDQPHRS